MNLEPEWIKITRRPHPDCDSGQATCSTFLCTANATHDLTWEPFDPPTPYKVTRPLHLCKAHLAQALQTPVSIQPRHRKPEA